jgi:hypothetical protein
MNKSLILNFEVLKELRISVEELLYLFNIFNDIDTDGNIDLNELERKKFIKIITENEQIRVILRDKSIRLIEVLTVEIDSSLEEEELIIKKSERLINLDINNRIEEFRMKWSGLKAGAMGAPQSCKDKLTRWMKENPDYSFDDVLKAADIYIKSLNGDYRFLQRADYFIYKQENNREESSRLSAHIGEIHTSTNDDWTTNLN